MTKSHSTAVRTARDYYNSPDADTFYAVVWGGEDIHVGTYLHAGEGIATASRRTVRRMAGKVTPRPRTRVLDIGSGFGGAARYLAATHGCRVTCLNLSEVENERNRARNAEQGLEHLIEVHDGSFEDLPFPDDSFDVVWSQDAFLHGGDRDRVLEEAVRVLGSGGRLIFTDPMAADGCPRASLEPILRRLDLDTMSTPGFYRRKLHRLGLTRVEYLDASDQLPLHYQRVLDETERLAPELDGKVSAGYQHRMKAGLRHWVDGGRAGHLAWGIFLADN